jgi:hypothetical protein
MDMGPADIPGAAPQWMPAVAGLACFIRRFPAIQPQAGGMVHQQLLAKGLLTGTGQAACPA